MSRTRRYRQPRLRAADSGRFPIPIVRGEVSELHRSPGKDTQSDRFPLPQETNEKSFARHAASLSRFVPEHED
jgi:hypothetical protein